MALMLIGTNALLIFVTWIFTLLSKFFFDGMYVVTFGIVIGVVVHPFCFKPIDEWLNFKK